MTRTASALRGAYSNTKRSLAIATDAECRRSTVYFIVLLSGTIIPDQRLVTMSAKGPACVKTPPML